MFLKGTSSQCIVDLYFTVNMVVTIIRTTTLNKKQTSLNRTPCRKFIHEFFYNGVQAEQPAIQNKTVLERDNSNVYSPKRFNEQPISNKVK